METKWPTKCVKIGGFNIPIIIYPAPPYPG